MNVLDHAHAFFGDSAHWHGYDGIPRRLLEHVQYASLALALAA
ncbi:ABC transporter permease, partial [Streptomyces sp. TRM76130]|nr:ABC transporter permease [Streptomyces sp. TRM76130]